MTTKPHALYLHGFASSPATAKGLGLGVRLRDDLSSYAIPQLEGDSFREMTMDTILTRAAAAIAALPADGRPLLLIGSSLGGYVAATLAARCAATGGQRPAALLLIAPAFGFTTTWQELLGQAGIDEWRARGERMFYHHAREADLPLGYGFLASCLDLPEMPGEAGVPIAIVHGLQDETVPSHRSSAYARSHGRTELHLVEGDHRLTEQRHEELLVWCARDLIARITPPA
jgi:pimeloyl-ACP methyl ester carboxylesterase